MQTDATRKAHHPLRGCSSWSWGTAVAGLMAIGVLTSGCLRPNIALDDFGTGGQSSVTGADDAGPTATGSKAGSNPEPETTADDSAGSDDSVGNVSAPTGGKGPDGGVKPTTPAQPSHADAGLKPAVSDAAVTPTATDDAGPPVAAGPVPTKLTFSVKTAPTGGRYSPRNIYAIWVVDGKGKFVKTLAKYAFIRAIFLSGWYGASGGDATDAVTGATMSSHAQRTATWNLTDVSGKPVPDGDYKIVLELTEADSTGPTTSIPFTKGPSPMKVMPPDQKSFLNMSLVLE